MKNFTLLLTENIEGLGIVGDVVTVKPGYARNFLVPRGYVTQPTEENIAALAERRKQVEAELAKQRAEREALITKLESIEITLERAANDQGVLFGGVSQHDIATALQEEGHAVEDRHVRIGEQIKRLDSYMIPVQLDQDLKTEIKLWVVSDRPMDLDEELEESGHGEGGEDAGEADEGTSSEATETEAAETAEADKA